MATVTPYMVGYITQKCIDDDILARIKRSIRDESYELFDSEILNLITDEKLKARFVEMVQNLHMKYKDYVRYYYTATERVLSRNTDGEEFPELRFFDNLCHEYNAELAEILDNFV